MARYTLEWDETGRVIFWTIYEPWGYDDAIEQVKAILEMAKDCPHTWTWIVENKETGGFNEWNRTIETMDNVVAMLRSDPKFAGVIGNVAVNRKMAQMAIELYDVRYNIIAKGGLDRDTVYREVLAELN
jgi:hypothetical protein